jgi:hypothetical protein
MAFIVKGGVIDPTKPKIKRFLVLGPGPSTVDMLSRPLNLDSDIITIGLHRVFPLFNQTGRLLDYWTWGDPHGAVEGLTAYEKLPTGQRPKIIVPHWMETLSNFAKHSGTSPLTKGPEVDQNTYHRVLESIQGTDELIYISNAVTTKLIPKNHFVFSDIKARFTGEFTYFNSAPFDAVHSGSNWTSENKFTSLILPICHYLGAEEVYCIGFDNKGGGIKRKISVPFSDKHKSKIKLWTDTWQPYHNMKIYNLSPPKYSPNHTFMETVSIDSILKK